MVNIGVSTMHGSANLASGASTSTGVRVCTHLHVVVRNQAYLAVNDGDARLEANLAVFQLLRGRFQFIIGSLKPRVAGTDGSQALGELKKHKTGMAPAVHMCAHHGIRRLIRCMQPVSAGFVTAVGVGK